MAESFGTDAERYDRARPRYPEALIERIAAVAAAAPAGPRPDVLDVGCGTGIVTRQFQAAGCRVLGIDPDARMAGLARQFGGEVEVARFEEWDPAGRDFDAVVAGQAWHWVDPAAGAAKAARVLRPGGLLAPFWNVFRFPPDVAEAVAVACQRALPDTPFDFRAMTNGSRDVCRTPFAKVADGMRESGEFSEPEHWEFDWEFFYTRDAWLDLMPTTGAFTRLPPDRMGKVLEGVGTVIDAMGGGFTMRYTTVAVTVVRAGAA
ncbi:class I SAM-dependent methyltransferase [Streptoverticillium reticulum]|uniref:class I SAM-dependent methyltransferase n=1 Tax=Streptoverticillium reticulum TaxID=1433415 RepID=UPI0039BFC35D